ncbi:YdcF family protein [Singulisphaera rosea]
MKFLKRSPKVDAGAPWRPFSRRRLAAALGLWLTVDLLYLGLTSETVLTWIAWSCRLEDPLVEADAIVLLLGGPLDRPARAADLYLRGLAPVVLLGSTEAVSSEGSLHRHALIQEGVPEVAIHILPGGPVESTYDEALRIREYVRSRPIRRIIVVTTAYHTRRAGWTFRKVLREAGVDVRVAASRDPEFGEEDWYKSDLGTTIYRWEIAKNLYYRLVY